MLRLPHSIIITSIHGMVSKSDHLTTQLDYHLSEGPTHSEIPASAHFPCTLPKVLMEEVAIMKTKCKDNKGDRREVEFIRNPPTISQLL